MTDKVMDLLQLRAEYPFLTNGTPLVNGNIDNDIYCQDIDKHLIAISELSLKLDTIVTSISICFESKEKQIQYKNELIKLAEKLMDISDKLPVQLEQYEFFINLSKKWQIALKELKESI